MGDQYRTAVRQSLEQKKTEVAVRDRQITELKEQITELKEQSKKNKNKMFK